MVPVLRALLVACLMSMLAPVMAVEALVLDYFEWEAGGKPYPARVLISPAFMRLDYGPDDAGFVLFDRNAGVIYSIQAEDQRILEIAARNADATGPAHPPVKLSLSESSQADEDAPTVAGEVPLITDYRVNGALCMQTVSIAGLLPEAVLAWREFALLMAAQRATTLANTPREYWQDCSLANDIYAPARYLRHGLPIREHSGSGLSRELRGFHNDADLPDAVFSLPKGFSRYRVGDPLSNPEDKPESGPAGEVEG